MDYRHNNNNNRNRAPVNSSDNSRRLGLRYLPPPTPTSLPRRRPSYLAPLSTTPDLATRDNSTTRHRGRDSNRDGYGDRQPSPVSPSPFSRFRDRPRTPLGRRSPDPSYLVGRSRQRRRDRDRYREEYRYHPMVSTPTHTPSQSYPANEARLQSSSSACSPKDNSRTHVQRTSVGLNPDMSCPAILPSSSSLIFSTINEAINERRHGSKNPRAVRESMQLDKILNNETVTETETQDERSSGGFAAASSAHALRSNETASFVSSSAVGENGCGREHEHTQAQTDADVINARTPSNIQVNGLVADTSDNEAISGTPRPSTTAAPAVQEQPQPQQQRATQSSQSQGLTARTTLFESITAHTAKCDLCNQRNDSGMSRCLSCGWQSCHACTIKNGCTRTHRAGSRLHTGPVDRSLLVSPDVGKGKGRAKAGGNANANAKKRGGGQQGGREAKRVRGEDDEDDDGSVGLRRRGQSQVQDQGQACGNYLDVSNPISPTTTHDGTHGTPTTHAPPSTPAAIAEANPVPQQTAANEPSARQYGAIHMLAFSLEYWGEWAREQRHVREQQRHNNSRTQTQSQIQTQLRRDEEEWWWRLGDIEPGDLHAFAYAEAWREFGVHRQSGL